ncbi:MAG: NADP-dependent isocitrate dehydrogenase [Clostridiaceae bacterium]|nr:NADP-dependent isocitrate dehydrogenase [Clostridiaceae bacterium]
MSKIKMTNPIVEIDGDEMTRVIWTLIKDHLLVPNIELNTEYYDLSLDNRDKTDDSVTVECANAIKKHKVGVKCATITPNAQRMKEYTLKKMWKSPNGTIREILDGTVFREPVLVNNIKPTVSCWKKPIIIARHAYGDVYSAKEYQVKGPGILSSEYVYNDGTTKNIEGFNFDGPGIIQLMHNKDSSISSFARSCFNFAIDRKMDLWFSTKDTISKKYDHHFKDIFQSIFENEYKKNFDNLGIEYFYTLIDDAVARVVRSEGGFIWALKNYDGDVMSDMVSAAFGSLAMMTSVLVSPNNEFEFEAAHGTVTRHYYKHLKGEETSTNPIATIFAWTGALRKKGEMDSNIHLIDFSNKLEKSCLESIEQGYITKDLSKLIISDKITVMNTESFIINIAERLKEKLK